MEAFFTVCMHYNGSVITSQSDFRKYLNGSILKCKVDPDRWSKEEAIDLLKDIGIFNVDKVFYSVHGLNFDEGLRDFKGDNDALKICDFASKGYEIHVYVTRTEARQNQHVPIAKSVVNVENTPPGENVVEVPVSIADDDILSQSFELNDILGGKQGPLHNIGAGFRKYQAEGVEVNMESRLEENIIESDAENESNEVEDNDDENEELPEMYDPNYVDPSGEGLWNIFVHDQETVTKNVDHEDHNSNSSATKTKCNVGIDPKNHTDYGQASEYNIAPMSLFGEELDDISDSDGDEPQDMYVDTGSESETDGEEALPKKKRYVEFRRQTDMNNPVFITGMIFKDHKEFKEAVTNYKINNNYNLKAKKQESKKVLYTCVPTCPWKLYASWNKEINALQVKTFINIHDCSKAYHSRMVNSRCVAVKMMDKIRRDPHYKISEIIEDIKEHYEVEISVSKATRARKLARLMVSGSFEEEYRRVRDYGHELLRTNPGSTVKYGLGNPLLHFKRMYMCLAACKKAFLLHCRPVVSVDACHLRGPISGQLLSAVGIDANDGMYPIACAVLESETKETWKWFFNNLIQDIGSAYENGWIFYSDQQKGLLPALADVFHGARHRLCIRHLYANFKKKYPGLALKELMEQAARETTEVGYEKKMAEIKLLDWKAEQYLRGIDPKYWCKHTFSAYAKCDMLLNNLAECFNSKIIKARDKPVITCLEIIRRYIMSRIHRNRDAIAKYSGPICPRIQAKLEINKKESLKWTPRWNGLNKYEVSRGKLVYVVDIKNATCRCYKWDITGIPCEHACAAIFSMNKLCEDYVHPYLSKDAFLRTYSIYVELVNGDDFWPNAGGLPILPPKFRTQPGRPRLGKRKKDVDEPSDPTKLSRKHTKILCSKCGKGGHNKRTCKAQQTKNHQEDPGSNHTNTEADDNNVTKKSRKTTKESVKSKKTRQARANGGRNKTVLCMGYKVLVDKQQTRMTPYNKASIGTNNSQVEEARGSGSTNLNRVQNSGESSHGSLRISEPPVVKWYGGRMTK